MLELPTQAKRKISLSAESYYPCKELVKSGAFYGKSLRYVISAFSSAGANR
jgi:hypothetical protein